MDQFAVNAIAAWERRGVGKIWQKWRAGEMIAQQRQPGVLAAIGFEPETFTADTHKSRGCL